MEKRYLEKKSFRPGRILILMLSFILLLLWVSQSVFVVPLADVGGANNVVARSTLSETAFLPITAKESPLEGYRPDSRKTTTFVFETLEHNKQKILQKDPTIMTIYLDFLETANDTLTHGPYSVMEKTQIPPSGNKHDYVSQAPFFWPDPTKEDGLPYIHRDGEVNPESLQFKDKIRLNELVRDLGYLSVAYYITENDIYAQKAISLIRVWFLDPVTKMNPNLDYAQVIPGTDNLDGYGIIEGDELPSVIDAFLLIQKSPSVTEDDYMQLADWFSQFIHWMQTSPKGTFAHMGNHLNSYNIQMASMAMFIGNLELAETIINTMPDLISSQILPDGRQPLELARTKSWWYPNFNLRCLLRLVIIGNNLGISMADYQAPNGGSIKKAQDYLLPYAVDPSKWPYDNIESWDNTEPALNLYLGARVFKNDYFQDVADSLSEVTIIKHRQLTTKYY